MAAEKEVTLSLVEGLAFRATSASGHNVILDAGRRVGGGNAGMRPTEAILVALGACGGMDVASILGKMRQEFQTYRIRVIGTQRPDHPRVYDQINVTHELMGDLAEASVRRAIWLSITRYCPVFAMLSSSVSISVEYKLIDEAGAIAASGTVVPGAADPAST